VPAAAARSARCKLAVTRLLGRREALFSYPYFYRGGEVSFWNRAPLDYRHGPDKLEEPGEDFLLSYWLGRSAGLLSASD